jgi:hypothetical protein
MDLKELGISSSGSAMGTMVVSCDRSNKIFVSTDAGDLHS